MAVRIGHASISENGTAYGSAGDSTGREVCTRDYYLHSKGWHVLRAIDANDREQIAKCMEDACANNNIGYCQNGRLSLYNAVKDNGFKCDKKSLTKKVECDCSSLVRVCLAYAGIKVGNFVTSNEKDVLVASGKMKLVNWDGKSSSLKRGDVLVTKTKGHTVIVLTDGTPSKTTTTTTTSVKVDSAKSKDASLAGTYTTTANLNLRAGAGTSKKALLVMPKGKKVRNYGYYTAVNGTKWLLVKYGDVTGFCSSKYLKKA